MNLENLHFLWEFYLHVNLSRNLYIYLTRHDDLSRFCVILFSSLPKYVSFREIIVQPCERIRTYVTAIGTDPAKEDNQSLCRINRIYLLSKLAYLRETCSRLRLLRHRRRESHKCEGELSPAKQKGTNLVYMCVWYAMVFMRCRSEKQRVKGGRENCRGAR